MAWSGSFTFAVGERLTSAKLNQLVEQLSTHDHRFDGTRGTPQVRVMHGTVTEARTTTGYLTTTISFGSRFDSAGPLPRVAINVVDSGVVGTIILDELAATNVTHTGADLRCPRSNATPTTLRWVAVQAIA